MLAAEERHSNSGALFAAWKREVAALRVTVELNAGAASGAGT